VEKSRKSLTNLDEGRFVKVFNHQEVKALLLDESQRDK
jgi:hypothetical protein